ncbi:hypothetical protein C2G38_2202017 [Gigaspora rosea]|uniref:Uncharacterized protein n=1 Tax=Gigaspora rosea TaxID=44941 RepID=A0A397UP20_9GLOM|nr:hypothetical protein C2G38_2202017 [Gigaspora rosea]
MPKKASSKRNTRTSKKTSANKKKFSSNNSIKNNNIHNDQDRSTRNHDSESPEPEGSESEGFEPENYTSFNNTHTSKGMSASQKMFTSSSKKQTFSLKHNDTLNDINKNIGSRNPREYNNEDFDPTPLNNNIEDPNYSHYRSWLQHSRFQSQRQSRSPRRSQYSNPRLSRYLHSRYSRSQSPFSFILVILFLDHQDVLNVLILDHNNVLDLGQIAAKVANQMAQYDGLIKSDNKESTDVLTQQETMTFQAYLKCLFFRTQHLTKAIINKCIRLCFPSRKFSHKDISALKTAANVAYRSYRDALRNGLKKVARCFIEDFKIESLSQVVQSDVQAYFQKDVWRSFLNRFFDVIDEEATFTTEFKEAW